MLNLFSSFSYSAFVSLSDELSKHKALSIPLFSSVSINPASLMDYPLHFFKDFIQFLRPVNLRQNSFLLIIRN